MRKNNSQIANNKSAYHEYSILETLEAGIVLTGTEVKSMRANGINMRDCFVLIRGGEAWLKNLHIPTYKPANVRNHDPLRDRKLLLTSRQINYLGTKIKIKGLTVIATNLRFNSKGLVKTEVSVAKGKKLHDKRADIKKRDLEREMRRDGH